jgi:hypothetical protein
VIKFVSDLIQHYVIKFVSDLIQHYVIKFVSDLIQHYVIKFVSHLWQVSGLLRVLRFPPPDNNTDTVYILALSKKKPPVGLFPNIVQIVVLIFNLNNYLQNKWNNRLDPNIVQTVFLFFNLNNYLQNKWKNR